MGNELPELLPVKFRPTSSRPRYRDKGMRIDTNDGLTWQVRRRDAIYLITFFPENWRLDRDMSPTHPKVTAVMPTTPDRLGMARNAIRCFQRQTWKNKEMVIISEGPVWLSQQQSQIREVKCRPGLSNAAKRNIGDGIAQGDYIIRWDDDDISHPDRISTQMQAVTGTGAIASTLSRRIHWLMDKDIAWIAEVDGPGLLLYQREGKRYEETITGGGSDSQFYGEHYRHLSASIDNWPGLYIRVYHGKNISSRQHILEQMPKGAKPGSRSFRGKLLKYFERAIKEYRENL